MLAAQTNQAVVKKYSLRSNLASFNSLSQYLGFERPPVALFYCVEAECVACQVHSGTGEHMVKMAYFCNYYLNHGNAGPFLKHLHNAQCQGRKPALKHVELISVSAVLQQVPVTILVFLKHSRNSGNLYRCFFYNVLPCTIMLKCNITSYGVCNTIKIKKKS